MLLSDPRLAIHTVASDFATEVRKVAKTGNRKAPLESLDNVLSTAWPAMEPAGPSKAASYFYQLIAVHPIAPS